MTVIVPYQKIPVNILKSYGFAVRNVAPILVFIVNYFFVLFPMNFGVLSTKITVGGQLIKVHSGISYGSYIMFGGKYKQGQVYTVCVCKN